MSVMPPVLDAFIQICPPSPTAGGSRLTAVTSAQSCMGALTWAQVATIAAALIGAGGVVLTLLVNAARARREGLANLYGEALAAVAEYLEGPYRILRKDGSAATRFSITSKLSDVKTAIDRHQELLRLHAPTEVSAVFDRYVNVAKQEAGAQMKEAWKKRPVIKDADVNLHQPLPRNLTDAARVDVVLVMQTMLARRWYDVHSRKRYASAVEAAR